MDFTKFSSVKLLELYGEVLTEMKNRGMIRSKNVVGDLGEYLVIEHYQKTKGLPKLQFAPPSTKNIDAISVNGERYSIKTTTGTVTGVFYGIPENAEYSSLRPLFEYVVVVKLDEAYQPDLMLELDWDAFFKHKRWHSRMHAYHLVISKALIDDGKIIWQRNI